jgi:hypothetical protein
LRIAIILVVVLPFVISGSTALAQVFYQYPGASTVEPQRFFVGTYLSGGDDLFRWGGYGRLGIAGYWDVGFEALVESEDSDWRGGAGGDLKYEFPTAKSVPFDVALNAGFGFASCNGATVFQAPLGGIMSIPLKTDDGRLITPYLGVYAVFIRSKVQVSGLPDDLTDNDLEALIRGGVSIELRDNVVLFGTLQLGPEDLVALGLNYQL